MFLEISHNSQENTSAKFSNEVVDSLQLKKTFSSKTKQKDHSKTQLSEKNFLFHDDLYHSFFSVSLLHVFYYVGRLPYIIKDDSGEGLRGL